ncbi:MAG TPA: ABC transporter ATP-binding protein [Amycolatopsis sp.]|nr:ABC transporter ATP-binding protein [Amycolatopsis sp.]HET6708335.1 ABC transporter ATP-binding protein [Amycolatopsis sp.]
MVILRAVGKVYGRGRRATTALDNVDLQISRGTLTAVMGPSGSGKSTLLHCAAGLDRPTSGSVTLDGTDLGSLDETTLTKLRRTRIGFVFQSFNLISALDVRQNIGLPLRLSGQHVDRHRVDAQAAKVGLGERLGHRPSELSGGQQQRVAIARALVTDPAVVFADEPTGALDTNTAREILELFRSAVRKDGQTVVLVTHDPVVASYADRVVFLRDGRPVTELAYPTADAVTRVMVQLGAVNAAEPSSTNRGR